MKYLLSLLILVFVSVGQTSTKCEAPAVSKAFADARAEVEKRMAVFSGKKSIAEKADALLSKLIAAKSPVIRS